MILQALYEYYQRKAAISESNMALEGWEWKEIPFLCIIDKSGIFKCFKDTREERGKEKRAHPYLVPSLGEKKGNGIKANVLWENIEYMFGIPVPTKNKPSPDPKRVKEQHSAFQEKINSLSGDSFLINAVKGFASRDQKKVVIKDEIWETVLSVNQNILLAIESATGVIPATDIPQIRKAVDTSHSGSKRMGICLITGDQTEIVRLEPAIKGVAGSDGKAERAVISFNKDAFCSYQKEKNFNAPVGASASFAYATALNILLGKDSQNKVYVGDATVVFWAEHPAKVQDTYNLENNLAWCIIDPPKDDPDRGVRAVRGLYDAIHTGRLAGSENRFYVLGLSPSAARISVRFWKVGTVRELAEKIKMHFDDFEIIHGPDEPDHLCLNKILRATALKFKMENVPPNLAAAVITSILDGTQYPTTLLQQCIRRIRAERHVNRSRAAILKAYINRFNRIHNPLDKEVTVSLDKSNTNPGYLLGRLFAVLERVQNAANNYKEPNAGIRDRFYGAFSSTPITVLPLLEKLYGHHLGKLEKSKGFFESLKGAIIDKLNAQQIPAHLTMDEQARFAIGYYHQRQDFFAGEKKSNESEQRTTISEEGETK